MGERWYVIGMYKTQEESKGWYNSLARSQYEQLFWEPLSTAFGDFSLSPEQTITGKLEHTDKTVFFRDLKEFDNEKDKSDSNIFNQYKKKVIENLSSLLKEFRDVNDKQIRVGLVGRPVSGLFYHKFLDKPFERDNIKYYARQSKYIQVLDGKKYGLIIDRHFSDIFPKNVSFYKLYNITSRYVSSKSVNWQNYGKASWEQFWQDA